MITIATSDWHMGDGSRTDDFLGWDITVIRFLEMCSDLHARLLLPGDIFELWQANWSGICRRHGAVVNMLTTYPHELIYCPGNHDLDMYYMGVFNAVRLYMDDDILMLHGDVFDKYNSPDANFGRRVTKVFSVLEWIWPNCDKWIPYKVWRGDRCDITNGVYRLAKANKRSIAIFGHTHSEFVMDINGIMVANCGSLGGDTMPYIMIDDGVVKLMEFGG